MAQYDLVGIGNALVDIVTQSDDAFLAKHGLATGGMMLIDPDRAAYLCSKLGVA